MMDPQYQLRNMEILVDNYNKTVLVTEECIACVKQVSALGGYSEETKPELRLFPLQYALTFNHSCVRECLSFFSGEDTV